MPFKSSMENGQVYTTKKFGKALILQYLHCEKVLVRFLDTGYENYYTAGSIRKGLIKDVTNPTVYGVGYIGVGNFTSRNSKQAHRDWTHMLYRCYSDQAREEQPTYKECSVCEEWHNFQNFAKWHKSNYKGKGFALDKDLIKLGNKVYCAEYCEYVPQKLNNILCNAKAIRGEYPIGVRFNEKRSLYQSYVYEDNKSKYLGSFESITSAFNAYKVEKEKIIKRLAVKLIKDGSISNKVYDSLINYEVNIDD